MTVDRIQVDLKRNTQYAVPTVTQNDTARRFIVEVTDDGTGGPELLDAYQAITMTSERPDGQSFYITGERIPGTNEVEFHLGTDETYLPGNVKASLQFYLVEDASRYTSARFRYDVDRDLAKNYKPTQREETLVEVVLRDGPVAIQEARDATRETRETMATLTGAVGGALSTLEKDKNEAIGRLDEVTEENKTVFRQPVNTFADLATTYPNPEHGTTVRVTSEAASYRFSDGNWVKTDEYNPTAIDGLTQQLADTDAEARRKKDLEDLSPIVLAAIEGGEGTSFNLESVPQDGSVTPKKTNFLKTPNNLINQGNVVESMIVDRLTGVISPNTARNITKPIEVSYLEKLSANALERAVFFDSSMNYTGVRYGTDITVPGQTTKWALFQYFKTDSHIVQINRGSVLLPYDNGAFRFEEDFPFIFETKGLKLSSDNLQKGVVTSEKIEDKAVTSEKTDFFDAPLNLITKSKIIRGMRVDSTNGSLSTSADRSVSHPIPVKYLENLKMNFVERAVFFDASMNFTAVRYNSDVTVPVETTAFVVLQFFTENENVVQVNRGQELMKYDNGDPTLKKDLLSEEKPYFMSADNVPEYFNPVDNIDYDDFNTVMGTTTYEDFSFAWRNLVTENSEYLNISSIGKDESGQYDIYSVSAKGTAITSPNKKPLIKISFITGIHGGEKTSQFSVYYLFKNICENWKENPALAYLRWNVHFEFIICASPWAFDNGNGRHNVNQVDINRNFESGWKDSQVGEETYGGAAPFSEAESVIIRDFVDSNKDAVFYADYHNHFTQDQNSWMWIASFAGDANNDLINRWSATTIRKCTLGFHKNYGFPYLESGSGHISSRSLASPIASSSSYARKYGIPSTTVECFHELTVSSGLPQTVMACTEYIGNYFLDVLRVFKDEY